MGGGYRIDVRVHRWKAPAWTGGLYVFYLSFSTGELRICTDSKLPGTDKRGSPLMQNLPKGRSASRILARWGSIAGACEAVLDCPQGYLGTRSETKLGQYVTD